LGNFVHTLDDRHIGSLPTASGGITRLAYAHAQAAGIEVESLLDQAGLAVQHVRDRTARIGVHRQIRFLNLVASAVGDEFLGFHLAQLPDLRELGLLYYVPASSTLLGEALQRVARYSSITNESLSLQYVEGKAIRVTFDYLSISRHWDRHQIEFCMTILIRLCRQLSGRQLMPSRVRLTHPRGSNPSEFRAFFCADTSFGAGADEVGFDRAIKNLPVVSADPYLNELLVANCEEAIARRPDHHGPLRSLVENAVVPLLPHGKPMVSDIAQRLGLSQRTFARRLESEGLSFSDILEGLRGDLARQYLADSGLSISQIAWLLGYQEPSAFTHAFKRWTGRTPRLMRERGHRAARQR
jgi:AraC-like DNA-binding protein